MKKILTLAGIGVLAAMAFLYLAPKVKPAQTKKVITKPVLAGPVYPPVHVNMPNNATKPIEHDYLALMARRR